MEQVMTAAERAERSIEAQLHSLDAKMPYGLKEEMDSAMARGEREVFYCYHPSADSLELLKLLGYGIKDEGSGAYTFTW